MSDNRKKGSRQKDLTGEYLRGAMEEDRLEHEQRFTRRSSGAEQRKIERTTLLRAAEQEAQIEEIERLPIGRVMQVYSLFYDVEHDGKVCLCVLRKTLSKLMETGVVVGDRVRFRETGGRDEQGRPEAVIEQAMDRQTVLTRANSFNPADQDPIVANAAQMLIVASLREPAVKWGLVDRMIVAARSGRLAPIVCLNKVDLRQQSASAEDEYRFAEAALAHYGAMGIQTMQTSAIAGIGADVLCDALRGKETVLAGHSGVGKSSLIRAIEPGLNIRIGAISGFTGKGRHTTSSSREYHLKIGGDVIDTPGIKAFGLWDVTAENLIEHFPDVEAETAPDWRVESYRRILESLGGAGD